jgi:2Fe-2S ferredoxin
MPQLKVTNREGVETSIEGKEELTVMELIRDEGVESEFALCGGFCSCATCHVYVDEADISLFQDASPEEGELLDSSGHRRPTSRLACQLPFDRVASDLRVTIAPLD